MMWHIVIIMFMPLNSELDALEVTHFNDKLLEFKSEEICYMHVSKHIDALRVFADSHYPGVPIKSIGCFQKSSAI